MSTESIQIVPTLTGVNRSTFSGLGWTRVCAGASCVRYLTPALDLAFSINRAKIVYSFSRHPLK